MSPPTVVRNRIQRDGGSDPTRLILPLNKQISAWKKVNRKMGWGIKQEEIEKIGNPPLLTPEDRQAEYMGTVLFYGFGDDGSGHSDSILSEKMAWEYFAKKSSPHLDKIFKGRTLPRPRCG